MTPPHVGKQTQIGSNLFPDPHPLSRTPPPIGGGITQLIQVRREVRILYLSRTTEINLTCQQNVSVNSFKFDVST